MSEREQPRIRRFFTQADEAALKQEVDDEERDRQLMQESIGFSSHKGKGWTSGSQLEAAFKADIASLAQELLLEIHKGDERLNAQGLHLFEQFHEYHATTDMRLAALEGTSIRRKHWRKVLALAFVLFGWVVIAGVGMHFMWYGSGRVAWAMLCCILGFCVWLARLLLGPVEVEVEDGHDD